MSPVLVPRGLKEASDIVSVPEAPADPAEEMEQADFTAVHQLRGSLAGLAGSGFGSWGSKGCRLLGCGQAQVLGGGISSALGVSPPGAVWSGELRCQ